MISPYAFERFDNTPDIEFYRQPRLVTHIEPATIGAVTQLYRELMPPNGEILDLMSSWVSHLPLETPFKRVVGLGLNRAELEANPRLNERLVHDLNAHPQIALADRSFDAAICCVSVQYLTQPVAVMGEIARLCRPNAPFIITFSNRCFPTKAVRLWQQLDDAGHLELVKRYLEMAGGWSEIRKLDRTPQFSSEPLLAVVARRI